MPVTVTALLCALCMTLVVGIQIEDFASHSTTAQENCGWRGMASESLIRVHFQVFGRVQGVFFRKYTQEKGQSLGLKGYCRNTRAGTVAGVMEGPVAHVEQMKDWLRRVGSPQSKIEKADFNNEEKIENYSFKGAFDIKSTA